jgi:uncharacterized protein
MALLVKWGEAAEMRFLRIAMFVFAAALAPVDVLAQSGQSGQAGEPQQLDVEKLIIHTQLGTFDIDAEIADEPAEQSKGLMFRTDMGPGQGMLFDFGETRTVTMWMKNTPLSLDMVFIRSNGTVARVAERTEPFSLKHISSGSPVSHVLELRGGVARMIGLRAGDRVEHSSLDGK